VLLVLVRVTVRHNINPQYIIQHVVHSAQQLKEVRASMGLEGAVLINFIREQQKIERKREIMRETGKKRKKGSQIS